MFEFAFHLGIHIECTNGTLVLDILDHYPPLPLFVNYKDHDSYLTYPRLTTQDELGIHHTLRLRDRVRQIHLCLPSSVLHKALVFLDGHFPILEHLFLSFTDATKNKKIPLPLPETLLAPNLRQLIPPDISPQTLFRFLTTTVSLTTLKLSKMQTYYIDPRLLVAHLRPLPQLEELSVVFSTPILRPAIEEELLGEEETPALLPNLKTLCFEGANTYLECLLSQIRTPLLEQLRITLFSQIALSQPRLSHFINATEVFKPFEATVSFSVDEVSLHTGYATARGFRICVRDLRLDWQVNWAAQICNALVPTISGVKNLTLSVFIVPMGPNWQPSGAVSTAWHALLRSFIRVKKLRIDDELARELAWTLLAGGVGSDPEFLPDLQSIVSETNMFTSFIDARQIVGRPVQFLTSSGPPSWSRPRCLTAMSRATFFLS